MNRRLCFSYSIIFAAIAFIVYSCAATKEDRLSKKDYRKNVKGEKIVLAAYSEGVAGIGHNFTLCDNNHFAYFSFAFGTYEYFTGEWVRNNSDTVMLNYYLNHKPEAYYPYFLLKKFKNRYEYIEFVKTDTSKRRNWQFEITYIDTAKFK